MWTHSSSGERLVRCIAGSRGCSPILLKSGYRHKEYGARDARFRGDAYRMSSLVAAQAHKFGQPMLYRSSTEVVIFPRVMKGSE